MAKIGRVIEERLPSGRIRCRIDFGYLDRKRVRLDGYPGGLSARKIPFQTRRMAEEALSRFHAEMLSRNLTLRQTLALWTQRTSADDRIGAWLQRYIEHFKGLVEAGKRSGNSLREIERYAQEDGHFGWWWERTIYGITFGDVEIWHLKLAKRDIAPKTQKNASDAFRAFLRWVAKRDPLVEVPQFPTIDVPEYVPRIVSLEEQARILREIPWERRGAFLAAATEALRLSEIRACDLDDYRDGKLRVTKAVQGPRASAPIRHTKNRSGEWRELWNGELIRWIEWRLEQATAEARLRGEVALFRNPSARNPAKRWAPDPMEREWRRACKKAGIEVALQEGTRHSILTALGSELPERMLPSVQPAPRSALSGPLRKAAADSGGDHFGGPKAAI
jgi:hypothetical protein